MFPHRRQLLSDCGIGSVSSGENTKSELLDTDPDSTSGTFSQHRVLIFCQMKQMIDIIETVYRGASKGRGLVISPRDYSTRYKA